MIFDLFAMFFELLVTLNNSSIIFFLFFFFFHKNEEKRRKKWEESFHTEISKHNKEDCEYFVELHIGKEELVNNGKHLYFALRVY